MKRLGIVLLLVLVAGMAMAEDLDAMASFRKGEIDAQMMFDDTKIRRQTFWWTFGLGGIAGLVDFMVKTMREPDMPLSIPDGVDEAFYIKGYTEKIQQMTRKASGTGLLSGVGALVVLVLVLSAPAGY